jgi:hypothetical protein
MLQLVLPSLKELAQLLSNSVWMAPVTYVMVDRALEVICLQHQWLWSRGSRDLADDLIPELVLDSWLFEKHVVWANVKHAKVSFIGV